jgi:hypothetical protein
MQWRNIAIVSFGLLAFLVVSIAMDEYGLLPWDFSYRVGCAGMCLAVLAKFAMELPEERWPWWSFWAALVANIGLFFTPIMDRAASRGELLIFALPDAVIWLTFGIASTPPIDLAARVTRQYMMLGLVVAILMGTILFAFALFEAGVLG